MSIKRKTLVITTTTCEKSKIVYKFNGSFDFKFKLSKRLLIVLCSSSLYMLKLAQYLLLLLIIFYLLL